MMELKVTTLAGKAAGSLKVSDEVFGLEPRADLMQRVVLWQLAKKQQGTHQSKGRAEISRTGAKMFRRRVRAALVTRRRAHRSSAAAARRTVRWRAATRRSSQEGPRSRPASCAVGQGEVVRSDHRR
jgi:ribosomal protein L4